MMHFLKRNADALPLLLPAFVFLFDIFATMVVLSHEPGITAKDALVYNLMLLPAGLVLSAMPAIVLNVAFAAVVGLLLSKRLKSN
jgi:hypothetical protein